MYDLDLRPLAWIVVVGMLVLGAPIGCLGHMAWEWAQTHTVKVEPKGGA